MPEKARRGGHRKSSVCQPVGVRQLPSTAHRFSRGPNIHSPCTTARLTPSPAPDGLRHVVLTRPGAKPSMRSLSVRSHFCARACRASRPRFAFKSGLVHPWIRRLRLLASRPPFRQRLAGFALALGCQLYSPTLCSAQVLLQGTCTHRLRHGGRTRADNAGRRTAPLLRRATVRRR